MVSKTKILTKISHILRCFTPSEANWTATELSKKLDIPVTTLHGILSDLVALDFLSQSASSKEYRIGLRYMEMGFLHTNNFELNNIAHGVMQELSSQVDSMVGLSVMYNGWMYVSMSVLPIPTVRGLKYQGPRLPAHCSAGGLAVLAHLPAEDIEKYQRMDWENSIPPQVFVQGDLHRHLCTVREQGYAVGFISADDGSPRNLGAPIFGREHLVIAGLVVIRSEQGFKSDEQQFVASKLMAAAHAISLCCGHLTRNPNYV